MNTRESTINKQNFLIDILSLNDHLFTLVNVNQLSISCLSVINRDRLYLKLTFFNALLINQFIVTHFKNWLKTTNSDTNNFKQSI
ncbi:hypothetical protein [Gilliamella sp. CG16]|uniref:hypothetical protein n=1 Tax=Gilliamella sp. CG16 TaxID=3351503 RepID=UPI00398706C2